MHASHMQLEGTARIKRGFKRSEAKALPRAAGLGLLQASHLLSRFTLQGDGIYHQVYPGE